ncbi:MAG: TrkH family potassium uptake protein [Dichotomicrobium sp.]
MNPAVIVFVLGWLLLGLVVLMGLPVLFAVALAEETALEGFLIGGGITGFAGGALVTAFGGQTILADRKHALSMLICAWTCLPVFAAIPFLIATPMTLSAGLFEAVSAFTTTGASAFPRLADVPQSVILWRAVLQWAGGLLTLVSAIAILLPLYGGEGFELRRTEAGGSRKQTGYALRVILPLYAGLTAACLVLLVFADIPAFDALCLALSTVSTGGFMPRDGTIALYGSAMAELVLTVFMFLGAVSIFWTHTLLAGRWTALGASREPLYVAAAIALGGVVLASLLWLRFPTIETAWLAYLSEGLIAIASLVTTTGFPVSEETFALIPFMLLLVITAIGAGRLSTAGGIKISRLMMMLSQSFNELNLLLFPHGIHPSVRAPGGLRQVTIATIWALFFLTMLVLALLTMLLAGTDIAFEGAMLAAVTALSNAGPVYEIGRTVHLSAEAPAIWDMTPVAHLLMCVAMILGRMELLAVLSLARLLLQRE